MVNPEGAPVNYDELVDTGLAHTGAATGLKFVRTGLTDDREVTDSGLVRKRPILIAWATPEEVPQLAGEVAGIGGSIAVGPPGRLRYVTGRVMLDRDLFATFDVDDAALAQAIVDHELGHVVGLAHVSDPGELMYKDNVGRTTYGPGDREGLARIGSVDC
ncbi:matrixin family metalloprotease [Nocardioides sp. MAHUQ-72]|uniref:matrixin family metalloprotease n=1 Tax=unclassified Nocardioides TaxID=2615069 RepID=UPI003611FD3A